MTTGTGDGLMQLLRQIADDLDELRGEERRHVSALEGTTKQVRAFETLSNAVNRAQQAAGEAIDRLPRDPVPPRIDSGPRPRTCSSRRQPDCQTS